MLVIVWVSYCCPTAAKAPDYGTGGFLFSRDLQVKKRADERTRTAFLLITSALWLLSNHHPYLRCKHVRVYDEANSDLEAARIGG